MKQMTLNCDNIYYVYRHIRADNGEPFYIGKGKGNRAYTNRSRNSYWKGIVQKYGYEVEIIITGLTEKEAYQKEIEFIKMYKSFGYCKSNFCIGGYHDSKKLLGKKKPRTKEHQEKLNLSQAEHLRKLNKSKIGKPLSEEIKKKISQTEKGKKVSIETREKLSKIMIKLGIKPPLRIGCVPWNKGIKGDNYKKHCKNIKGAKTNA